MFGFHGHQENSYKSNWSGFLMIIINKIAALTIQKQDNLFVFKLFGLRSLDHFIMKYFMSLKILIGLALRTRPKIGW
jgi:hypothetical protein